MKNSLVIAVFVMSSLGLCAKDGVIMAQEEASLQPDKIFLCIGQSNMAGRAPLAVGDDAEIDGVLLLNSAIQWEPARHPLNRYASHRKSINKQRFGPAGSFAQVIRQHFPHERIGIVVNARGSTSIAKWDESTPLYQSSIKRLKKTGLLNRLAGVVWVQGYNDSKNEHYAEQLSQLIDRLRRDCENPDLPIVVSQIALPAETIVNQQILLLPSMSERTAVVENTGLSKFDGAHFDRDSQITLGQRLADAWLGLTSPVK